MQTFIISEGTPNSGSKRPKSDKVMIMQSTRRCGIKCTFWGHYEHRGGGRVLRAPVEYWSVEPPVQLMIELYGRRGWSWHRLLGARTQVQIVEFDRVHLKGAVEQFTFTGYFSHKGKRFAACPRSNFSRTSSWRFKTSLFATIGEDSDS